MRPELQIFERIESYLTEQMSSVDRTQFEVELTTNSVLATQLEFQENLMQGIENVALKAAAKSAHGKYKVANLVSKIFLSCLIIAVGFTATLATLTYIYSEPTIEGSIETNSEYHGESEGQHGDEVSPSQPAFAVDTVGYGEECEGGDVDDSHGQITDYGYGGDHNEIVEDDIDIVEVVDEGNHNSRIKGEILPTNDESAMFAVPLSFSPDGDGLNDYWQILTANMKEIKLTIYQRQGKRSVTLFSSTDPTEKWDGTSGGLYMPEGKYSYTFHGEGNDGIEYDKGGKIILERKLKSTRRSSLSGLKVELLMKNESKKVIDAQEVVIAADAKKIADWNFKVNHAWLTTFHFRVYSKKSRKRQDLIYESFDPNFRSKWGDDELFEKTKTFYYTIDGIGLDGQKWFIEDRLDWVPSAVKIKSGYIKLKPEKSKTADWKENQSNVSINSSSEVESAVKNTRNVLTPNGDGHNDVWRPVLENIKTLDLRIVSTDKSRTLVYESDDISASWDGTTENVLNPVGHYIYTLNARGFDNKNYSQRGEIKLSY